MKHPTDTNRRTPPAGVFVAATVMMFFLSLSAADSVGFVPDYIDGTAPLTAADSVALSNLPQLGETSDTQPQTAADQTTAGVLVAHILIPAIGLDLPVQNPATRDINVLDTLLQQGPARYVDSAKLGETGNTIIFAHSSHLPIVHNQMFRAFNDIPNLVAGDSITLVGADGNDYLYSVTSVRKADVGDTTIDMSASLGTRLTLVTCDTLTGKSARYVLSADFVGTAPAATN